MSATAPVAERSQVDAVYESQRLRLTATIAASVAATWATHHERRQETIDRVVQIVTLGQAHTVRLVDAYLTAKTLQATGVAERIALDPAHYTTATLRGLPAAAVYSRPFGAYGTFLNDGAHPSEALQAARASVSKLAATDLQLAHTRSARDWLETAAARDAAVRVVGYRRVLAGPGPHCKLCEAASTRTYRVDSLLPIHEHCTCGIAPLYGTEPVASVGTTVRVDDDPELGPRLMAADWTPVGPRLIDF